MTKRESALIDEAIELLKHDEWHAGIRLIRQAQGKVSEYDLTRADLAGMKIATDPRQFTEPREFQAPGYKPEEGK